MPRKWKCDHSGILGVFDDMSATLEQSPPSTGGPDPTDAKLARRMSRRKGLFAPDLLATALKQAFIMLRPDIQWKNPVMFVVEVGTVLTFIYTIAIAFNGEWRANSPTSSPWTSGCS